MWVYVGQLDVLRRLVHDARLRATITLPGIDLAVAAVLGHGG